MHPASRPIRWIVFSGWSAVLIGGPICAPSLVFGQVAARAEASQEAHDNSRQHCRCACGEQCHCLVCCCSDRSTKSKPTPAVVKTEVRNLGIFETRPAFVNPPAAVKGDVVGGLSGLGSVYLVQHTLVSQCTCLRV